MPTNLLNLTTEGVPPTPAEESLLTFAFGQPVTTNSVAASVVDQLAIPITTTMLFILFSLQPIDDLFATILPDHVPRIIFKAILFFVLVWLFDRLIARWRANAATYVN